MAGILSPTCLFSCILSLHLSAVSDKIKALSEVAVTVCRLLNCWLSTKKFAFVFFPRHLRDVVKGERPPGQPVSGSTNRRDHPAP
ncbi:hypothetical protein VFPPC_18187 [Pochonia chlamydosporia 170]|uniref:Secreted protein n=1 Tax=Pochonia chlamydosporia 170 TaxID=1380566 RepID=A0A219ANK5_METCM|nr:hypothetical protein VFPPC_18187 [Pochonia chlamydosporia 170]OWT42301.1 hypothetical protein VFPPC_18187 [Pochonia chlamydosporia 170]